MPSKPWSICLNDLRTDLCEWLDKWHTHANRMRNLLLVLAALLAKSGEAVLLMELGECMTDYGEDIVELMGILREYA